MANYNRKQAVESVQEFFGQFGTDDIYNKIVLESFFEALYAISIPSPARQEGYQIIEHPEKQT